MHRSPMHRSSPDTLLTGCRFSTTIGTLSNPPSTTTPRTVSEDGVGGEEVVEEPEGADDKVEADSNDGEPTSSLRAVLEQAEAVDRDRLVSEVVADGRQDEAVKFVDADNPQDTAESQEDQDSDLVADDADEVVLVVVDGQTEPVSDSGDKVGSSEADYEDGEADSCAAISGNTHQDGEDSGSDSEDGHYAEFAKTRTIVQKLSQRLEVTKGDHRG
ncbi:hypothetical protein K435DRAFT_870818 [Dendrothele bispora CBS 962.96]|uniref:Uncharacterized protein n=1 Tax=Dendrothele bispora (strain CBS 962.96) TaxID=1314807 RepID=A0A4S8L5N8_DENBC|nr:hypothetical protein K435DRAFT_870818 [Dendrothele bispora CBS 962.96]